jgi:hypothetical protein
MRVWTNWVLPFLGAIFGAMVGFVIMGLPGVFLMQTIDGVEVPGGVIPPDVFMKTDPQRISSHFDFYGVALWGHPAFWLLGVVGMATFIGYRIGSLFKIRTAKGEVRAASEQGAPT